MPGMRGTGRSGIRTADDPLQGKRLGEVGPPRDERTGLEVRRRHTSIGVDRVLDRRRNEVPVRLVGIDHRDGHNPFVQERGSGEVDACGYESMRMR
jgi:hypothetical protein